MSTSETDRNRKLEEERRRYAEQRDLEDREPRVIEQSIDATRADMRATLEALERRFSFDRLVDMTVGRIRERGGEFASNLTDSAARNPMPLVLTSIGLAWMMLTSQRGRERDDYSTRYSKHGDGFAGVRARATDAADKMHGAAEATRDTLKHAADSSRDALQSAAQSSRETYRRTAESVRSGASTAAAVTREQYDSARARFDQLLNEQPLILGALGLAAGAIIGALLPTTDYEDRFLGEARDKTLKSAAETSRERLDAALEHAATYSAPGGSETAGAASSDRAGSRPH